MIYDVFLKTTETGGEDEFLGTVEGKNATNALQRAARIYDQQEDDIYVERENSKSIQTLEQAF